MYQNGARHAGLVYEDTTYGYGLAFNFIAAFTNGKPWLSPVCMHIFTYISMQERAQLLADVIDR